MFLCIDAHACEKGKRDFWTFRIFSQCEATPPGCGVPEGWMQPDEQMKSKKQKKKKVWMHSWCLQILRAGELVGLVESSSQLAKTLREQKPKKRKLQWRSKTCPCTGVLKNSCLICTSMICRPPVCAAEKVNGGRPLTQSNVHCDSLSGTLCFNYSLAQWKRSVEEVACDAVTSCVTKPSQAPTLRWDYSWTSFGLP